MPLFDTLIRKLLIYSFLLGVSPVWGQAQTDSFLEKLLKKHPSRFGRFLENPGEYEIQILYTKIDRNTRNNPYFTTYRYQVNPQRYFYPAGTITLPAAALALEKLNNLKIAGLDKYADMLTLSDRPGQVQVLSDTTAESGAPSVAHYIRRMLLASDPEAYNRLYEFLGQSYFNEAMVQKGYRHFRATHRLGTALTPEENRHTNPIRFKGEDGELYFQPGAYSEKDYRADADILRGEGYMKEGKMVREPFNFRDKNFYALTDQHEFLKNLMFPYEALPQQRLNLTPDDYTFLYRYMSQLPVETAYPEHYTDVMDDGAVKYLLFGNTKRRVPRHIRSFNKIGIAYGYLLDNAYIADFEMGVEFLLSAVIYCNKDRILKDDRYDYDEIGYQFMADLGKTVLEYELQRKRRTRPDLERFEVEYDK